MNMPAGQSCSNFMFRLGFSNLVTFPTAQSGLTKDTDEQAVVLHKRHVIFQPTKVQILDESMIDQKKHYKETVKNSVLKH